MEGYCSTDHSPQWAVVPVEEEKEEEGGEGGGGGGGGGGGEEEGEEEEAPCAKGIAGQDVKQTSHLELSQMLTNSATVASLSHTRARCGAWFM